MLMVNSGELQSFKRKGHNHLSAKTISVISCIITFILLLAFGLFMGFMQLVALNGFSESEGLPGLIAFGVCQIAAMILSIFATGKLAVYLISKSGWAGFWSSVTSIFAGFVVGALLNAPILFVPIVVIEILKGG